MLHLQPLGHLSGIIELWTINRMNSESFLLFQSRCNWSIHLNRNTKCKWERKLKKEKRKGGFHVCQDRRIVFFCSDIDIVWNPWFGINQLKVVLRFHFDNGSIYRNPNFLESIGKRKRKSKKVLDSFTYSFSFLSLFYFTERKEKKE